MMMSASVSHASYAALPTAKSAISAQVTAEMRADRSDKFVKPSKMLQELGLPKMKHLDKMAKQAHKHGVEHAREMGGKAWAKGHDTGMASASFTATRIEASVVYMSMTASSMTVSGSTDMQTMLAQMFGSEKAEDMAEMAEDLDVQVDDDDDGDNGAAMTSSFTATVSYTRIEVQRLSYSTTSGAIASAAPVIDAAPAPQSAPEAVAAESTDPAEEPYAYSEPGSITPAVTAQRLADFKAALALLTGEVEPDQAAA